MHILQQVGLNLYDVVVHAPAPGGSNSAGVAWATAIQNSGLATTQMTVGNGAGQITQAEANQIASGSVIEAPFQWGDDPAWSDVQRTADLDVRASQAVAEASADLQRRLKFFGKLVA